MFVFLIFCTKWRIVNVVCGPTVAGKLLGRTQKIAFNLLHKVGPKGDPSIKPGDRVSSFHMSCTHDCQSTSNVVLYWLTQWTCSYYRMLIGNYRQAIEWYQFWWFWVMLALVSRLQYFSKSNVSKMIWDRAIVTIEWVSEWVSSVLRPYQHIIGYTGDGFYRSKDPTNSIKVL